MRPEADQLRLAKLELDLGGGSVLTVKGSLDGVTPATDRRERDAVRRRYPGQARHRARRCAGGEVREPVAARPEPRRPALGAGQCPRRRSREAAVQLGLEVDPAARSAEIVSAHGSMRYHDLTINYFSGLAAGAKGQRHRHASATNG